MLNAPPRLAHSTAANTYGVAPLAAMPTTTSLLRQAQLTEIARRVLPAVLRAFDRTGDCFCAACDQSAHQAGRCAERGRTLRSIEHGDASAGTRTHIDEAPANFQARHDGVHRARNWAKFAGHGARHTRIFAIHQAEQSPANSCDPDCAMRDCAAPCCAAPVVVENPSEASRLV